MNDLGFVADTTDLSFVPDSSDFGFEPDEKPTIDERGRRRVAILGEMVAAERERGPNDQKLEMLEWADRPIIPPAIVEAGLDIGGFPRMFPGARASLANTGAGMTTPLNAGLMVAGGVGAAIPKIGGAVARGIAGGFGADMARHLPETATALGTEYGTATPEDKQKILVDLATSIAMPAAALSGAIPRIQGTPPRIPDVLNAPEAAANRAAVNLAAPGTVRPSEIIRWGPPETALEAPAFNIGEIPFERMQRFGGQTLPPVEILPKMGRLPDVEILSEPRTLLERETRGKTSFGADAPTLVRNAQELPPALVEAMQRAEDVGLKKSAQAAADVPRGTNVQEPYRAPKELTAERVAEQERKAARASVEEGLYVENPPMEPLTPDVSQFPEPPGMPGGTLSGLQSSRILAGKENVRSNVSNNPPVASAKPTSTEAAWQRGLENRTPEGIAKLETEFADVTGRLKTAPTDALLREKQLAREALDVAKGDTENALANKWVAARDPVAGLKALKGTEGTAAAQELGAKITTREQLADLKKTHVEAEAAVMEKLKKAETDADLAAIGDEQQRAALIKEAIESAVGLGRGQKFDKTKLHPGDMQKALAEYNERMAGDTPIAMEPKLPTNKEVTIQAKRANGESIEITMKANAAERMLTQRKTVLEALQDCLIK